MRDALQRIGQDRAAGAGSRIAADLLVIEQHDDCSRVVVQCRAPGQRLDSCMARSEVVDSSGRVHLAVLAEAGRRGQIVRHDIPRQHCIGFDRKFGCQELAESVGARFAEPPHRGHVLLAVQLQAVVRLPIEMNRELRDS